jgi:DNA-binding transcriptional LysR family regulator
MQRLEAIIGEPLLSPDGRGRSLTPIGEELIGHARRILSVHQEAWLSLKGARASGRVVLATTQDFADGGLPDLLRKFAQTHPRVRLDLRIGRTQELTNDFEHGECDVLISMRQPAATDELHIFREPMVWLCATQGLVADEAEIPLALLDPPCGFRTASISALDAAGRSYRIAATSPSLSGLLAAVRSGIAITPRTARSLGSGIERAPVRLDLPPLIDTEFSLRLSAKAAEPASDLAALLAANLEQGENAAELFGKLGI